jgi:hypothetical protein
VAELVRSLGEHYESSLPWEIGAAIGPLVVIGFCIAKLVDAEVENKGWYVVLIALAIGFYVQVPAAVSKAKSDCEQQFEEAGGHYGFPTTVPLEYTASKCAGIWPQGPERGATGPVPLP